VIVFAFLCGRAKVFKKDANDQSISAEGAFKVAGEIESAGAG
jgi:hypothetical protein